MGLNSGKSMAEIRDAEADKYYEENSDIFYIDDFKAGFDCRDKLDNEELQLTTEALKIAIEALENSYMALADCASRVKAPEPYMFVDVKEALAEIRRLRGER